LEVGKHMVRVVITLPRHSSNPRIRCFLLFVGFLVAIGHFLFVLKLGIPLVLSFIFFVRTRSEGLSGP
jgi:hypothetical protein